MRSARHSTVSLFLLVCDETTIWDFITCCILGYICSVCDAERVVLRSEDPLVHVDVSVYELPLMGEIRVVLKRCEWSGNQRSDTQA